MQGNMVPITNISDAACSDLPVEAMKILVRMSASIYLEDHAERSVHIQLRILAWED